MLFTFLGWTTINIFSQVGFITLVGLIAKNGILIVEFANQLQAEGRNKVQAICEAAATRLRPVLMTATITAFGLLPLLFASGPGSEIQRPLAIVVIGGLATSTLLTLILLPILYQRWGVAK